MKGRFRSPKNRHLICAGFIAVGTFFAVWFGVGFFRETAAAAKILSAAGAIAGFATGIVSLIILRYNYKASLTVDADNITAIFDWGKKVSRPVSDLLDVQVEKNSLTFYFTDGHATVRELMNALEIGRYAKSLTHGHFLKNPAEEQRKSVKAQKKAVFFTALTIVLVVLMFALTIACIIVTHGRDISDFTDNDNVAFAIYFITEIVTVAASFVSVRIAGHYKHVSEHHRKVHLLASAYADRMDCLNRHGEVIKILYHDPITFRIVIFKEGEKYGYIAEDYSVDVGWYEAYPTPLYFDTLSEVYNDIYMCFSDLILEELH